jgi:Bacterial Ig-like domain (group 1)
MQLRQPLPFLAAALAALTITGCEVDRGSILAPTDATLRLTAAAAFLPVNQATTLTIALTKMDGSPVADGTEVILASTLGELSQRKVRMNGGSATVPYRAGSQVGVDRIEASSGALSAALSLPIGSGQVAQVQLSAQPGVLPPGGGTTELTAWAFSPDGQPVVGVPVTFEISAGSLTPKEPVTTNADGIARAQLTAGEPVTVKASALAFASFQINVPVRSPVDLNLSASTNRPGSGQPVVFTVSATRNGQPAQGPARIEFGNGQVADLGIINGTATATQSFSPGGYNVTAIFTDEGGIQVRQTVRIDAQSSPSPGPSPGPPPGAGGDQIDPRTIRWLSPASTDVSGWRITSTVTSVEVNGDDICINHTKAGQWPLVSIDGNPPNIEGNPMIVVNINGQWYGAGFDWFGQGRTCKHMPAHEYGRDQIRVPPLDASWPGPRSGDLIGFLVSTPSSDRIPVRSVNERSNIVLIRWP